MNYKGTIIEESLQDASVLKDVTIVETKVEPITPEHKTPWLRQWTLHSVEIPEEKAQEVAEKISRIFDIEHPDWYADYKNDLYHFIIYAGRVYKVDKANLAAYQEAKDYGISIGIPEYQLDFVPKDSMWER